MGDHSDAIIAILSTIILGSGGFFLSRTLDQIDQNIKELFQRSDECKEERHDLSERICVLESHQIHRGR